MSETIDTAPKPTLLELKDKYRLSPPIKVTSKTEMKFGKPNEVPHTIIPIGTPLEVHFSAVHPNRMIFEYNGRLLKIRTAMAHQRFGSKFKPAPTIRTLEKYSMDGISRTVTGQKTEPDGFGNDGAPSWLLVSGVI